jgi:hypothetical protein
MGKSKYIETPAILLELFNAYKKEVKSKPFIVKDWVGKDAEQVYREKERPLTMQGFETYCAEKDVINDLGDYFSDKDGKYSEYSTICSRIKKAIQSDQIEGGMAGMYNPSITQRLNGLTDKQEIDHTGTVGIKEISINVKRNRDQS